MYRVFKGIADRVCALLGTIVLLPLFLLVMLVIVLDSKGKPIIRQQRTGKDGKLFAIYKFRSMYSDHVPFDINHPVREKCDSNLTRVGRVLRRTKIDELIQLWNVVRGEMSLVGPRPLLPEYDAQYEEWEKGKYAVKPGMTGLAQVYGNGMLNSKERSYYDVTYARKLSLGLDCKILLKTVKVVLVGEEKCLRHVDPDLLDAMGRESVD